MKTEHVALITARGGSKGLPRKNILPVNGTPLIVYTIKAALNCPSITRVYVSTDDQEIAQVSRQYGADVIVRPQELATDTASSVDVILHAIDWLETHHVSFEIMTLLQPTSPMRTSQHLNEAIDLFKQHAANLVISAYQPSHTPLKTYVENPDGSMSGLYSDDAPYMRRQDLPRAFQPNGAIYTFNKDAFKLTGSFPRDRVYPYVMSELDSIDIDTLQDLIAVEQRLKEVKQ